MGILGFLFKNKKTNNDKSFKENNETSSLNDTYETPYYTSSTKAVAEKKSTNKTAVATLPKDAPNVEPKSTESTPKKKNAVTKTNVNAPAASQTQDSDTSTEAKKAVSSTKNEAKRAIAVDEKAEVKTATKTPQSTKKSSVKNAESGSLASSDSSTDEDADRIANDKASETVKEVKSTRNGKFEIKRAKDGRYVFNLYASNHVIVATSQVYSSSQSAINGIKSIIANAERSPIEDQTRGEFTKLPYPKWEMYIDKGSQYRFRLLAPNGSCIVHSQGYTSKSNCKNGIDSIIRFAKDAEITKAYLKKSEND